MLPSFIPLFGEGDAPLTCLTSKGPESSNLLKFPTGFSNLAISFSSLPAHHLAVKLADGKVVWCKLKPVVNHQDSDVQTKLEKGWCILCDLAPVEGGSEDVLDGKLIGAAEWDGENFRSILEEVFNMNKPLEFSALQKKWRLKRKKHQGGADGVSEELDQLEKQRLELELMAESATNFFDWATLFILAVVWGIFVRLIWWEWNWDAVEPFTFVFMYSLLIAGFAYFVLTKKDLTYQGARLKAKKMLLNRFAKSSKPSK